MDWKLSLQADISTLPQLHQVCTQFIPEIDGQVVFLLVGEMGSGKTEFVKQLLTLYLSRDVSIEIASPSYALHHQYKDQLHQVEHWDLYRLTSEDDLESVGFWESFEQKNLSLIEWADKLNFSWLPRNRKYIKINFKHTGDLREIFVYQAA